MMKVSNLLVVPILNYKYGQSVSFISLINLMFVLRTGTTKRFETLNTDYYYPGLFLRKVSNGKSKISFYEKNSACE